MSSKSSPLLETKCICSVSSAWAFCGEFKQDASLAWELSGYFFSVDRKWIFYETKWNKKHPVLAFVSVANDRVFRILKSYVSVLLLIIKISQLAREIILSVIAKIKRFLKSTSEFGECLNFVIIMYTHSYVKQEETFHSNGLKRYDDALNYGLQGRSQPINL